VTIFIIKKNNNNAFPLTTFARGHKVTAGCDVTTPARLPAPSWQRATFFERAIGSLEGPKGISRPTDAAAAAESPRLEDLTYIFCAAKFQISTSSAENLSWKTGSCKNREGIVRRSTAVPSFSSSLDELLLSVLVLFITPEAYLMIFVKVLTLTLLHHDYVSVVVWQNCVTKSSLSQPWSSQRRLSGKGASLCQSYHRSERVKSPEGKTHISRLPSITITNILSVVFNISKFEKKMIL